MKSLVLIVLAVATAFTIGCKEEESIFTEPVSLPSFYSKLSPMQKKYYDELNQNIKKSIAASPSAHEEWEAFLVHWRTHTRIQERLRKKNKTRNKKLDKLSN